MKQYNVGVIGATGMVGQRFITLLENHPWFNLVALAASARSAGKTYEEAVGSRWLMKTPMPESVKKMVVLDAAKVEEVAAKVDFVFCAVNMKKDEIKALEEAYAKAECPVVSNNSAHRFTPDVPMVVPEINADHIEIIPAQRKRLGTKRGFVAVKSNCSLQSYVPALHPLRKYGISDVLVCTYQAISGAGKTFETFPDILDNVIPYIGGEEEKSEQEPLKLWGRIEGDKIVSAESPRFTAQCLRVPVSDGHMGAVFVRFENKPSKEEILQAWKEFHGPAQDLELPSAPKQFLHYFEENDRPQPKLDRMLENGMAVSIGRLREDNQYDYKFVCLSHNTLRGAAGGAVLLALIAWSDANMAGICFGDSKQQAFTLAGPHVSNVLSFEDPVAPLTVGTVDEFIEYFMARHSEARVDYVHDEPAVRALTKQGGVAFLLPPFEKSDLFKGIVMGGVLPRKTFSMGHAEEKRYYIECRRIKE